MRILFIDYAGCDKSDKQENPTNGGTKAAGVLAHS